MIQPRSMDLSNASSRLDARENLTLRVGELQFRTTNVPLNQSVLRNKTIISKNESMQLIPNFRQFLAFLIACGVPEVRSVLMQEEGKLLRIFIVVDNYDFDLNERIYDKEEHIMDVFNHLDFDFHITCQHNVSDPSLEKIL